MTLIMSALLVLNPISAGTDFPPYLAGAVAERVTKHPENIEASLWWSLPEWARCPQWWHTAQAAGWELENMPTVDYIMRRESTCNPNAHNPSGASGLVQWMPFWFTGRNGYGWVFNPYDPYEALYYMHLRVERAGWHDWCLRGDPVTGNC
jgi:hypothetical protein